MRCPELEWREKIEKINSICSRSDSAEVESKIEERLTSALGTGRGFTRLPKTGTV